MDRFDDEIERLAYEVIGAAIEVHRVLGPGHPENVYCNALDIEFRLRGIPFQREFYYAVLYKDEKVGEGRIDFLAAKRLAVEIKAVEDVAQAHRGRTANYITYLQEPLGLLINFNVLQLKNKGINRFVQSMFKR